MTLSELAQHSCEIVGKTDSVTLALAKGFIRRRWRMVWDQRLWKQSVAATTMVVLGSPTLSTEEDREMYQLNPLIMPYPVGRVLAVKEAGERFLEHNELVRMFIEDTAAFQNAGNPISWTHASPVGVYTETKPYTAQTFTARSTESSDSAKRVKIRENPEYGTTSEVLILPSSGSVSTNQTYKLPFVSKEETSGTVTVQASGSLNDMGNEFYGGRTPPTLDQDDPGLDGGGVNPTVTLSPTTSHVDHQRVKLGSLPEETSWYTVIFKCRCSPLDDDIDAPSLPGVDDCLIAHCVADLLERFRQYGKASSKRLEAIAQFDKMNDLEVNQQASSIRITPASYEASYTDSTQSEII